MTTSARIPGEAEGLDDFLNGRFTVVEPEKPKAKNLPPFLFVFDVESIGLHGDSYAVAGVVLDDQGNQVDSFMYSCPPGTVAGNTNDRKWVKENIPEIPVTHFCAMLVRKAFWDKWLEWQSKKALMFADCGWPVEAKFLAACVSDNLFQRSWEGPLPLHEIATVILARGGDPLQEFDRNADELPRHNPLRDAIQSARILWEFLNGP